MGRFLTLIFACVSLFFDADASSFSWLVVCTGVFRPSSVLTLDGIVAVASVCPCIQLERLVMRVAASFPC